MNETKYQLRNRMMLEIPQPAIASSIVSNSQPAGNLTVRDLDSLIHSRRRRAVRSQSTIVKAILEACRTPSVQHWIMVKARLGYDTFWTHMNHLLSLGMMNTIKDGSRTLYTLNEKGIKLLQQLDVNRQ